jgi:hypothetical protein
MEMTLSIAVQLVGGHADYVVKVGTPIFGNLLAPADRTPDNVQRVVNDMVLVDRRVTVKEMSVQLGIVEASVCRILKHLGLKNVQGGFRGC